MGKAALRGVVRAVKSKTSSQRAAADDCFIGSTRRRGPDLEHAILDATLDLLAESASAA